MGGGLLRLAGAVNLAVRAGLAAVAVAALLIGPETAAAVPPDGTPMFCAATPTATLFASPPLVEQGQSTTVHWGVDPKGCQVRVSIDGFGDNLPLSGSRVVTVPVSTSYSVWLHTLSSNRVAATGTVTVNPPSDDVRQPLWITSDSQREQFRQAIATPNTLVRIAANVVLNMSGLDYLPVAAGVHIIGARTADGVRPRLYTSTYPERLFIVGRDGPADNVRISGLSLDGGQFGPADAGAKFSFGVTVNSSVNVEIDNNILYGWRGAAVEVDDERHRLSKENPGAVHVHDNTIRMNKHLRGFGYGVEAGRGAYVLVERNAFDGNRHAIAADGDPGTGYLAYHNLILEGGGEHYTWPLDGVRTHQVDVHGTESCLGVDYYCGQAGEYFDIRHNAIYYTAGTAIKIRGRPTFGADVARNVFAHTDPFGGLFGSAAVVQHDETPNVRMRDNQFGVRTLDDAGWCDFSGDGRLDRLLATGESWWYETRAGDSATKFWVFLNSSTRRLADLSLSDVDGDGRCDITAGGVVHSGGRAGAGLVLREGTKAPGGWQFGRSGTAVSTRAPGSVGSRRILGSGDFDGDSDADLMLGDPGTGTAAVGFLQDGALVRVEVRGTRPGAVFEGAADFDGNGVDDPLWRLPDGAVEVWPAAAAVDAVRVTRFNNSVTPPTSARIVGTGDFDADGSADILWRSATGELTYWRLRGNRVAGETFAGFPNPQRDWTVQAVADFDRDGRSDILLRAASGHLVIWRSGWSANERPVTWLNIPDRPVENEWKVEGAADVSGDGHADIIWRHDDGRIVVWMLVAARYSAETYAGTAGPSTQVEAVLRPVPRRGIR